MNQKIIIQDNFFDKDIFKKIQAEVLTLDFTIKSSVNTMQKGYHNVKLNSGSFLEREVIKKIKTHFNISSIKKIDSFYLLSFPGTPEIIHNDDAYDWNCLINIVGEPLTNNGLGFYIAGPTPNEKILNSLIGFKENRCIFFDSKIWHSPLHFAGGSSPRYALANFINVK